MKRSRHIGLVLVAISALAVTLATGCTPEEEQAFRDAVNTAVEDFAMQAIDFAFEFGRQALAAFLL